ncbi:hypothetical protein ACOMHN_018390 [Nucella lapillus]
MNLWLCFLISVFGGFSWEVFAQKKSCPALTLKNGRVRIRGGGQMAYFRCRKKFKRVGHKLAVCLSSGTWSQQTPVCVGRGCPDLGALPDVTVKEMYRGGILQFSCPEGMRREGPQTLLCDGTNWDKQPPRCLYGASLGCDFEDSGLCGWNQDANDDFDWTWTTGFTPTTETGPDADHTTGTGHYIFMESSAPQKFGQVTRLISPPYQPPPEPMCIEFFYHMKGPPKNLEVGDLDVYIRTGSNDAPVDSVVFHRDGYQSNNWVRGLVTIADQSGVFKIVFAATRRQGWSGDIALDDIRVFNCSDMPEETTSTTVITTTTTTTTIPTTTTTIPATTMTTTTTTPTTTTTIPTPTTTTTTITPSSPTMTMTTTPTTITTMKTSSPWVSSSTSTTPSTSTSTSTMPSTTSKMRRTTRHRSTTTMVITPSSRSQSSSRKPTSTEFTSTPKSSLSPSTPMKIPPMHSAPSMTTSELGKGSTEKAMSNFSMYTTTSFSRTTPGMFLPNASSTTTTFDGGIQKEGNVTESMRVTSTLVNTNSTSEGEEEHGPGGGRKGSSTKDVSDYLPLIVGVSLGLVVGMAVVGVLAWLWARNRRKQKEIQIEEDQLNIIGSIDGASYSYPPSGSEH